jgi:hypothetical protein
MWPFTRTVPAPGHASCSKAIASIEERLEKLELGAVEQRLQVLDVAERVAEKLAERVRKRNGKKADEESPGELLRRARATYGVHAG